ncbi:hypothetical protein [Terrisporobacter sp.]
MGNLEVKYLVESQEKIVVQIRTLLKNLQDKEFNEEIDKLYESFLSEACGDIYTYRECRKVLITLYYSLEMINENLDKNTNLRKDIFFRIGEETKSLVEEIIEGVVISARGEHEESKLKYYGYLLGNIMFKEDLDLDQCNRLIKISRNLSYCQIKLINMYVISQTIQVPILKREDYTKIGVGSYKLLGILQDTLDMIQKSILNGSGKLVLDIVQINPSKVKVQGIGNLLYNNMSLNKMPYDELEDLLDILSKAN